MDFPSRVACLVSTEFHSLSFPRDAGSQEQAWMVIYQSHVTNRLAKIKRWWAHSPPSHSSGTFEYVGEIPSYAETGRYKPGISCTGQPWVIH